MKFVQETVLEKLPVQPWFLQTEIILPLAQADKFVELPADYNSLDTTGGVWIAPAILAPACQTVVPTMPAIPNQRLSMVTNGDAVSRPIGDSVEPFFDTSVPDDSSLVCLAE
jgi:hypothetical protein